MNDGNSVATPASTLCLALLQAVECKRWAACLFSKVEGHASLIVVAPATAVPQRRAAPSSRSPQLLEASPHPTPLPRSLLRPSSTCSDRPRPSNANVRRRVCFRRTRGSPAASLSYRPPRCNSGAQRRLRGHPGPAMPHSTSLCLPSTLLDPRRPTTMNDGAPVVTPASALRLALPQAVERKRSAARLFSEVKGQLSHAVVASATAVQLRPAAPSPRSRRPLKAYLHLPAPSLGPLRPAQAHGGERRRRGGRVGHRGATKARSPNYSVAKASRGPRQPLSTSPHPLSGVFDPRWPTAANDGHAVRRRPRHKSAKAPGSLSRPPRTLSRASSTRAGPRRRTTATRCDDGPATSLPRPGRPLHLPAPPSVPFDPRRPTAANDGGAVVVSATTVQRRRHHRVSVATPRPPPQPEARGPLCHRTEMLDPASIQEGSRGPSVVVIAPATTVQQRHAAPSSRLPRPREAPRSPTTPSRTLP
ncbi:hypothetical protein SCP_0607980 [Sparassis crispa]|uniref:Uncharacterized protein n=1 Tax=Sparassis crispa TaxID=139825 RepID=A0A401GRF9_9APHY|nr:hypothetical protein SCP_0607980 [Sparassis crispa]GBE84818.1 hypothetical protein SCP_0607980 [Sparassis crispa]